MHRNIMGNNLESIISPLNTTKPHFIVLPVHSFMLQFDMAVVSNSASISPEETSGPKIT